MTLKKEKKEKMFQTHTTATVKLPQLHDPLKLETSATCCTPCTKNTNTKKKEPILKFLIKQIIYQ